jgi:LysR family hydrogen peroxide-inducible transcriptional activator
VDLPELRAFLAVVDEGGFHAAARAIYVSQPAVTRMVQRLESEVGGSVFSRGPGGIKLTTRGEQLIPTARRLMALLNQARNAANPVETATLRLGTAATAAGSFLARFLSEWIPAHPELRILMLHDGAARLRSRLEEDECDAAIVAAPVPDAFDHLPITTVRVQACLPPGHPLANSTDPLSVHDLHGQRLLVNGRPFLSTELLYSACRLGGTEPDIVYECGVGQTLAALAEAGLGIAVFGDSVDLRGFDLPRRFVHDGTGMVLAFDLHVAWRRSSEFPPIVMQFFHELSTHVRGVVARR